MTEHSDPYIVRHSDLAEPFTSEAGTKRLIATVARQALEIVNGYRPATSLAKVLTLEEKNRLEKRTSLVLDHRTRSGISVGSRVSSGGIHICIVNSKVLETTAIVRDSLRPRFVTMRWEYLRSGWKVTVLELG